ncbi:MAG: hypothetical protein HP023_14105 [Lachnospiraceae bacterium]|nr:hypothetical protein [Lachnospiraceae bacterium]
MDLTIGSFNVENLSLKNDEQRDKCKIIADIILRNKFDIVALQEVQDKNNSIQEICKYLKNYAGCDSSSVYERLRLNNFCKSNTDYAYIWNRRQVQLCTDPNVYSGLAKCLNKCWDHYLENLVRILIAIMQQDKGISLFLQKNIPLFPDISKEDKVERYRPYIEATLRKTLRPPLIACFVPGTLWGSLFSEIRLINTHVCFGEDSKKFEDIRRLEMKFIQGELHTAINTFRAGNFRSVYTIIAGDFNLSLAPTDQISMIYDDIKSERHQMTTVQTQPTTKNGFGENYDHFAFDANHITERVAPRLNICSIPAIDEQERNVSNHIPIKMNLHI